MNPKMKHLRAIPFLLLIFGLTGCASNEQSLPDQCIAPKGGFSVDDLSGIWTAQTIGRSDTLILRSDGHYKQIVHIETPRTDYESEWLPWSIEGMGYIAYVRLDGLSLCAVWGQSECLVHENDNYSRNVCMDSSLHHPPGIIRLTIIGNRDDNWGLHLAFRYDEILDWSYARVIKDDSIFSLSIDHD
jgi:hypothetical protein